MYVNDITTPVVEEPLELFPANIGIKPFLKWAGGKTQLIAQLSEHIPASFNKYIEPFIGGGSFFFYLNPSKAVIADSNQDLVVTYKAIRDQVDDVISVLEKYRNEASFFYELRALEPKFLTTPEQAARLIYLNKTCFNGLYRVNKKGQYNVPYGKNNGEFLNKLQLKSTSRFLQNKTIIHSDYKQTLTQFAESGDFIFLDPPYYPVGKYADFKRYTKESFCHDDHYILKSEFDRLVALGCHVVLTNSDHPIILELFQNYKIKIVETRRLISSNSSTRTGKDIIVIGQP